VRIYVITTGTVFALLALAHVWRIVMERQSLATEPDFIIITAIATALSIWAWRLVRAEGRR
jgi:hypothetical protein